MIGGGAVVLACGWQYQVTDGWRGRWSGGIIMRATALGHGLMAVGSDTRKKEMR
jgi:hypothetical protein